MSGSLSEKRLGDILSFVEAAEENNWHEGTTLTRAQMGGKADLTNWELHRVIRAIKENPDLGISVSTKRGRDPITVVTLNGQRVEDAIVQVVHVISVSKAQENFKRTVRDASTSFVAYKKANKTMAQARDMRPYVSRLKQFLMAIHEQAVEDNDPFDIREMTERALAEVGVHYDDDNGAVV